MWTHSTPVRVVAVDELLDELRDRGTREQHIQLLQRTLDPVPTQRATLTELLALFPAMNAKL